MYCAVTLLESCIVTKLIFATLALHNILCKSPDRAVHCPTDLVDTETGDEDKIPGSWRNDNPQD